MSDNHINLQAPKTNKIYGVIKQGANKSDQNVIRALQKQGYNEHEIQSEAGVHFSVVRTFMLHNNPDFEISEASPNPDTQHLHDRIAELEGIVKDSDESRVATNVESVDDEED